MAVAWSHYGTKLTVEKVYAAGNGIADWLGLRGWKDVITMQHPKRVGQMRKLMRAAS